MSRRHSRSRKLLTLLQSDEEELAVVQPQIQRVRALQRMYAGPIIAAGLFNTSRDLWSGILAAVAKQDGQDYKLALDVFFERLRSTGVDVNVPCRVGSTLTEADLMSDVCLSYASCWGDSGFILGLAVGMQLGPDALWGNSGRFGDT